MTEIRKFTINGEEINAEIERLNGFLRIKIGNKVHDILIEGAPDLPKPAKSLSLIHI